MYVAKSQDKRPLSTEQRKFLRSFQAELRAQDNLATAYPIFWTISDIEQEVASEGEDYDTVEIVDEVDTVDPRVVFANVVERIAETRSVDAAAIAAGRRFGGDLAEAIIESDGYDDLLDGVDDADLLDFCLDYPDDVEACGYSIYHYRFVRTNVPGLFFLTHEEARDYISRNRYKFKSPRTFCWHNDSDEFAKLYDILLNTDWGE